MIPSPVTVLRGRNDCVNCVQFMQNGYIASGTISGFLNIWNLDNHRTIFSTKVHESSILSVLHLKLNHQILSCARDGLLKLWKIENMNEPLHIFDCGAMHFCNASRDHSSDHNENLFASPSRIESEILLWDTRLKMIADKISLDSKCGMTSSLYFTSQYPFHNFKTNQGLRNKIE
jgi:WD40 repeat protein